MCVPLDMIVNKLIHTPRDANLLTQKNQTDNPKKSDFPHKNRIFTKSSETIATYHNFLHLRMLAQRHDSNSYS